MDNAGISLFQGNEINLSNAKQMEEDEEDLEEQRRRNEELQNLVMAKLDDFNFDESTVNSSTNISVVSTDDLQKKYCDTTSPNEQIKILYDVRLREINHLREEYENYKKEKSDEIKFLKNKIFVYEAEVQQMKISLKNSEELLVEKTNTISEMKNSLNKQNEIIKEHEITIKNLQIDINSYQGTITELHLKLEAEKNPFKLASKHFSSQELQRVHQDQIARLEALLEEKTKTANIIEKEKFSLQKEMEKYLGIENEDKTAIDILTKNFESTQKQCHDLIEIIEKLTNENNHLKDRAKGQLVGNSIDKSHNQSNNTAVEKLKKMLLDKSIENEGLEAKLRDYENNVKELLEYRVLKSNVYKKEFQQCELRDHTKSLLLMQNDLQNYKRLIDDKNQQILTLNSTNKELLEKLEEMLSQTRNDIKNFSDKYSLPQLQKMTEDLRKSQDKIAELEAELKMSEEKRLSLVTKFKETTSPNKEIRMLLSDLQQQTLKDKIAFENQLKKLTKEIEIADREISNLKSYINQLVDENAKLKLNIKNFRTPNEKSYESINPEESLKKQYKEAIQRIHDLQKTVENLEETIQDLINAKTLAEGEQCNLCYQINDYKNKVEKLNENIQDLESEVQTLKTSVKEKKNLINELRRNPTAEDFEELENKFLYSEQALKLLEDEKNDLFLQIDKLKDELVKSKDEVIRLTKEIALETEKNVRRNLENELNETQNALDKHQENESNDSGDKIIGIELKLREEIQKEYLLKLKEIEHRYEKSCVFNKELFKEQAEKMKIQETKFREQLGMVLTECAQKMKALEDKKEDLLQKYSFIQQSFENYKQHVGASEEAYKRIIKESQTELQSQTQEWKNWSKKFVKNCIEIENIQKMKKENFLHKCNNFDKEVASIEKTYNDKIKKYVKNCKMK